MILGERGLPAVAILPRVAARLERPLSGLLADARRRGRFVDAEVADVVRMIVRVGRAYRQQETEALASDDGTFGTGDVGTDVRIAAMTSSDVAERLRTSTRNVTSLAQRGRLPAHRIGRRWLFDPIDVAEYVRSREDT